MCDFIKQNSHLSYSLYSRVPNTRGVLINGGWESLKEINKRGGVSINGGSEIRKNYCDAMSRSTLYEYTAMNSFSERKHSN